MEREFILFGTCVQPERANAQQVRAASQQHFIRGLRKVMGTSKYVILVPLFDMKSLKPILPRAGQGHRSGGTRGGTGRFKSALICIGESAPIRDR